MYISKEGVMLGYEGKDEKVVIPEGVNTIASNVLKVKNIDGKTYMENDNIIEILSKHISNPVRFTSCLQTMYDNGIDTFVEIGPGRTLSSFVKRMKFENSIKIMNVSNCEELEILIKEVKNL